MRSDLVEWHVTDYQVQRVPLYQRFGYIVDNDFLIRIELFHNPAGNVVYLNRRKLAVNLGRHHADKVSDTSAEFAKVSFKNSGFPGNLPHKVDQKFWRIMAIESRSPRRNIFL